MKIGSMCINWKVVAGFVVIGLGIWAIAPNLVGAAVPLLLLAVCPLSMFFMMRGMGSMGSSKHMTAQGQTGPSPALDGSRTEQLALLKARSNVIAREIAQLEAGGHTLLNDELLHEEATPRIPVVNPLR